MFKNCKEKLTNKNICIRYLAKEYHWQSWIGNVLSSANKELPMANTSFLQSLKSKFRLCSLFRNNNISVSLQYTKQT
jgi:hypothetical protein